MKISLTEPTDESDHLGQYENKDLRVLVVVDLLVAEMKNTC